MLDRILVSAVFFAVVLSIFVNREVLQLDALKFLDVPYYWSPLLGAALVWIVGGFDPSAVYTGLFGSGAIAALNASGPFSTVILFLSIAFISLCLEVSGFFRYLAVETLKLVDGSGRKLFFAVFWISGFLALFTSNDILILTFTPFLIEFLDKTDLDALPFLIAEFFAANVFSMVFLVGNETNIIVATAHSLGFVEFLKLMALPGFAGGIACFTALYFVFRDKVAVSYSTGDLPGLRLNRWEVLSFAILAAALVSLAVLSTYGYLLWHVGLIWAGVASLLFVAPDLFMKRDKLEDTFLYRINGKMPWEVVPFLTGFFLLVQSFQVTGLTALLTESLTGLTGDSLLATVFGVGAASTVAANLLNNIPMTALMSDVLAGYSSGASRTAALYSLVVGSNIGANVTPIGALAGIMWMKMVNRGQDRISFREFFRIGWKVTLLTGAACLSALYLVVRFTAVA